jgi:hypothetical protein
MLRHELGSPTPRDGQPVGRGLEPGREAVEAMSGSLPLPPVMRAAPSADESPASHLSAIQRQVAETRQAALSTGLASLDRDGSVVFRAPERFDGPVIQRAEDATLTAPETSPPSAEAPAAGGLPPIEVTSVLPDLEKPLDQDGRKTLELLAERLYPRLRRRLVRDFVTERDRAGNPTDRK